jgi:hypothetical protein
MAELGNLTARIVLSLQRMSTVKIRTGSRFHTPSARIGAAQAAFSPHPEVFLRPPQVVSFLHRMYTGRQPFPLA